MNLTIDSIRWRSRCSEVELDDAIPSFLQSAMHVIWLIPWHGMCRAWPGFAHDFAEGMYGP
jgi:hypothetical protein